MKDDFTILCEEDEGYAWRKAAAAYIHERYDVRGFYMSPQLLELMRDLDKYVEEVERIAASECKHDYAVALTDYQNGVGLKPHRPQADWEGV